MFKDFKLPVRVRIELKYRPLGTNSHRHDVSTDVQIIAMSILRLVTKMVWTLYNVHMYSKQSYYSVLRFWTRKLWVRPVWCETTPSAALPKLGRFNLTVSQVFSQIGQTQYDRTSHLDFLLSVLFVTLLFGKDLNSSCKEYSSTNNFTNMIIVLILLHLPKKYTDCDVSTTRLVRDSSKLSLLV